MIDEYTEVKHKLTGEILLVLSQKGVEGYIVPKLRVRDSNYKELLIDADEVEELKNEDENYLTKKEEKLISDVTNNIYIKTMLSNIAGNIEEIYEDILCLKKDLDTTYSKMEEK